MTHRKKKIIHLILTYFALALLLVFFLFPFITMLSRSLMTDNEIRFFPRLFPESPSFSSYAKMFDLNIVYMFLNTFIIAAINIIGIPLSASLCAYGFAKLKFPGRNIWFAVVLATMMIPSITTQIPLYIIFSNMNWVGTWKPLTVPAFFGGGAINIFLIRQFMRGISDQLCEAGKIDGANKLRIYFSIVLTLCMPIIAFLMVTVFFGVWGDFMTPMMYLSTSESKYTISLGLYYRFNRMNNTDLANTQMAIGLIMMSPCILLFFLFQKQLIEGVTMTGIKG